MPFGQMVEDVLTTMVTWMKNWILPLDEDGKLVWYLAMALGLTLCWMVFSNEKTKEFFNNLGGWVVAAMFFAIALGFLISIPMYFWNIFDIWWVFKVVIFLVLYWLIGFLIKLAGGFLWTAVKTVWGWARAIPARAKANPHVLWKIAGGLFLAGLICGEKAYTITEKWGLVPGIIPGISSAVGIIFLVLQLRRTALGESMLDSTLHRHEPRLSDNASKCGNRGVLWIQKSDRTWIEDPSGRLTDCPGPPGEYKGWNPQRALKCLFNQCDEPSQHWILQCDGCGLDALDPKKNDEPIRRVKVGESQKCKCGKLHPAPASMTGFHSPLVDRANPDTPGAVAPSTVQQDGSWLCQGSVPEMIMEDGELKNVPIRDEKDKRVLGEDGEPQMKMKACGKPNTAEAIICLDCGTPKPGHAPVLQGTQSDLLVGHDAFLKNTCDNPDCTRILPIPMGWRFCPDCTQQLGADASPEKADVSVDNPAESILAVRPATFDEVSLDI